MGSVGRGEPEACGPEVSVRANRAWWDAVAAEYQAEHGTFLGDADFVWCPEGLREADARLLGAVRGADVLEIGCGAAQCARWLRTEGARVVGIDLSAAQLRYARRLDERTGVRVPAVVADAAALPLADGVFDVACSAYGALPFVADVGAVLREVHRVLRPSGRFVFSVSHPIRWCFPDDPGPGGLTARYSYFDRRPYVEYDADGALSYVEHHRTIGDWVNEIVAADLTLDQIVEPPWPEGHEGIWGGWSPLRGRVFPGTAIFLTHRT
ncbi:MAG TPA: methyltransferase domain-containing protein [Sporichthyaceae bacterium]|nr:methyltransferase domain-containing protein [Sporichthyaceae bacterium]